MSNDKPSPKPNRNLITADKQLGAAESALLNVCDALNRHGERDHMLAQLRTICDQLRAMDPIKKDSAPCPT